MNILAIKSSGDHTSISVILDEEINTYSMSHERKERPDWDLFLSNIGHKKIFNLKDIDLFAFANSQHSYTATRTIASYMKGIAIGLDKPLIVVSDKGDIFDADEVAKEAKENFLASGSDHKKFDPNLANPTYEETNFKKLNE
jgi:tRNA A37 threonylcarbamoyltransferase TsaD|tara:strand:+ start:3524 stop:3949 length:426 start_codon:yes stop_codon:yes gene_type:complete